MKRAVEFAAWAAFGLEREDWVMPAWWAGSELAWLEDAAHWWRFNRRHHG